MARFALGEFEHLVLLAIVRLGGEGYGVPIIREIESRTGREISHAALYLTLRRLESKGLLRSRTASRIPDGAADPAAIIEFNPRVSIVSERPEKLCS